MPQSSAPLVGANLSDVDWRDLGLGEAGVAQDFDGSAYALSLGTDSDVARIGSATQRSVAHVANFKHVIPMGETEPVTIPPAVGTAQTSIIALRYDPLFQGAPGPVRVVRIPGTSSALPIYDDASPGIEDLALWAITRQPGQALSQAVKRQLFHRLCPNLDLPAGANLPSVAPLGATITQGSLTWRRVLGTAGTPTWQQTTFIQATAPTSAPEGAIWYQVA